MKLNLSTFEQECGHTYPIAFKEFLKKYIPQKVYRFNALDENFHLINPDDFSAFKNAFFIEGGTMQDYLQEEFQRDDLVALPVAKSTSGDGYGFLFFIATKGSALSSTQLYYRNTDRRDYNIAAIGDFFNFVVPLHAAVNGVSVWRNGAPDYDLDITGEKSVLDFIKTVEPLNLVQFKSHCAEQIQGSILETTLFHQIDTSNETHQIIQMQVDFLRDGNRYFMKCTYIDTNPEHRYSYQNGLYYNYYSILHTCQIDLFIRLREMYNLDDNNFNKIFEGCSFQGLLLKSLTRMWTDRHLARKDFIL